MGLEVTVLVVLLSRCSYMTEEKQRASRKQEKWKEETEVTGGWRTSGVNDRVCEGKRIKVRDLEKGSEGETEGRDQHGCCGLKPRRQLEHL